MDDSMVNRVRGDALSSNMGQWDFMDSLKCLVYLMTGESLNLLCIPWSVWTLIDDARANGIQLDYLRSLMGQWDFYGCIKAFGHKWIIPWPIGCNRIT